MQLIGTPALPGPGGLCMYDLHTHTHKNKHTRKCNSIAACKRRKTAARQRTCPAATAKRTHLRP